MTKNDAKQHSNLVIERAIKRANGSEELFIDHIDSDGKLLFIEQIIDGRSIVTHEKKEPSWFTKITKGFPRR